MIHEYTCPQCGEKFKAQKFPSTNRRFYSIGCGVLSRHESPEKRFWKGVIKTDSCWLWSAGKCSQGYGSFSVNGVRVMTHRFSWELHNGSIPDGLFVCHECDTPACVRPDHLFLGTHLENVKDSMRKGRFNQGSKNGISKLNEELVIELRKEYQNGVKMQKISKILDISYPTLMRAINGATWKHVV